MSRFEKRFGELPENLGWRSSLEVGGTSKEDLIRDLELSHAQVDSEAKKMLQSDDFTILERPERLDLVSLTVAELGFSEGATTREIYEAAANFGLELCPAEVGPRLRMQRDVERTLGKPMAIAMKPLMVRGMWGDPTPKIFSLYPRYEAGGPWLNANYVFQENVPNRARDIWDPHYRFVFVQKRDPQRLAAVDITPGRN